MTCLTQLSYNFCWAVRTLAEKDESGRRHAKTPAMAAGLTDRVWTLKEWVTLPHVWCWASRSLEKPGFPNRLVTT
jgi:hypothetical protein